MLLSNMHRGIFSSVHFLTYIITRKYQHFRKSTFLASFSVVFENQVHFCVSKILLPSQPFTFHRRHEPNIEKKKYTLLVSFHFIDLFFSSPRVEKGSKCRQRPKFYKLYTRKVNPYFRLFTYKRIYRIPFFKVQAMNHVSKPTVVVCFLLFFESHC